VLAGAVEVGEVLEREAEGAADDGALGRQLAALDGDEAEAAGLAEERVEVLEVVAAGGLVAGGLERLDGGAHGGPVVEPDAEDAVALGEVAARAGPGGGLVGLGDLAPGGRLAGLERGERRVEA